MSFESPVGTLSWSRRSTPRLLSTIAKGLFVAAACVVAVGATRPGDPSTGISVGIYVVGALLAWALWIASYILSMLQTSFPGALRVEGGNLLIGRDVVVPLASVEAALVVERPAPTVEIHLASGDRLTARFADDVMARSVADALGFGARGRRVRASLATPIARLLHPLYAFVSYIVSIFAISTLPAWIVGRSGTGIIGLLPFVTLALYEVVRRLFDAPTLTVGDDGARIERGFRKRRVPLRELAKRLRGYYGVDAARRTALERLAAEREGATVPIERRQAFSRSNEPLATWRARVGDALVNASYRGANLTADDARATLVSADATAEERIGAALALRRAGEAPERIRVAAEAFVDPRLRVALEAVADGDDARADDALRKLAR